MFYKLRVISENLITENMDAWEESLCIWLDRISKAGVGACAILTLVMFFRVFTR